MKFKIVLWTIPPCCLLVGLGSGLRSVTPLKYGQIFGTPPDINQTGALVQTPHNGHFRRERLTCEMKRSSIFFADSYVRKRMFQPSVQNYWLGVDNCIFYIEAYGELDDSGVFHYVSKFDPPFAQ